MLKRCRQGINSIKILTFGSIALSNPQNIKYTLFFIWFFTIFMNPPGYLFERFPRIFIDFLWLISVLSFLFLSFPFSSPFRSYLCIKLSSGASSAWLRRLASRLRMNLHNRFQLFEFVVFLKFLKSDITNQQMVVYK